MPKVKEVIKDPRLLEFLRWVDEHANRGLALAFARAFADGTLVLHPDELKEVEAPKPEYVQLSLGGCDAVQGDTQGKQARSLEFGKPSGAGAKQRVRRQGRTSASW